MSDLKEKRVELILQQLQQLPTLPSVAVRIMEITGRDDSSIAEVVQRLRSDAKTKDIPILIYTAKELTAEDRRVLRDRVQAITSKSSQQDLLRELQRLAKRKAPADG